MKNKYTADKIFTKTTIAVTPKLPKLINYFLFLWISYNVTPVFFFASFAIIFLRSNWGGN